MGGGLVTANGNGNGLTLLQRRFINHWFETGGNATEAARLAGYKGTENTLGVTGHGNLRKPKIREVIESRLADETMSANELLFRITRTARMDISPYVTGYGRLTGLDLDHLIADGHGHLIKGIKPTKEGTVIEFHDAQKAMDQLLKYYGLGGPGIQVNIDQQIAIAIINADPSKL